MAQNIEITYNGYTIGAGSSRIIDGKFSQKWSYRQFTLDVSFLVTGTNDSGFLSNVKDAEDKLEVDDKKLVIKYGPTGSKVTYRTFDPSNFSSLQTRTSLNKTGSEVDTDRSRIYRWTINIDLPADSSDDDFRQEASWKLNYTASRRVSMTFSGTYTAGNDSGAPKEALQTYEDKVSDWVSTIFSDLFDGGGILPSLGLSENDFEKTSENFDSDDEHHKGRFNITYTQVLYPESAGSASGTTTNVEDAIIDSSVKYERSYDTQNDKKKKPPVTVRVNYSCSVDWTETDYSGLAKLWKDTIKPHLIDEAKDHWSGKLVVVQSGSETLDMTSNGISASMTILISGGENNIMSHTEKLTLDKNENLTFNHVWDGKPHTYTIFTPSPITTASVRSTTKKFNNDNVKPPKPVKTALAEVGGGYVQTSINKTSQETNVGVDPDGLGESKKIFTITWNRSWRYVATSQKITIPKEGERASTVSARDQLEEREL